MTGPRVDPFAQVSDIDPFASVSDLHPSNGRTARAPQPVISLRPATPEDAVAAPRTTRAEGMRRDFGIPDAAPRSTLRSPVDALPNPQAKKLTGLGAAVLRNVVDPALNNPLSTVAMLGGPTILAGASPLLGAAAALPMMKPMADQIGGYLGQKAAEVTMDPVDRARAESDPERLRGDDAAVQAAMLALPFLVHGGVKAYKGATDVGGGMMESGVTGLKEHLADPSVAPERTGPPRPLSLAESIEKRFKDKQKAADQLSRFAAGLEEGETASSRGAVAPQGLQTTPERLNPRAVAGKAKPQGLEVSEPASLNAGKVKPVETVGVTEPLEARAVEMNDPMRPRRRASDDVSGETANPPEETVPSIGAGDAPSVVPADVPAGEPPASYPEGFSMGGSLRDNRIPGAGEIPKSARGTNPVDGLQSSAPVLPEGATPETVAAANAMGRNRYRAHTLDQLDEALLDAQSALEKAQADQATSATHGLVGERAQADMENRGTSYADEHEFVSKTADKALARAKTRLAEIEREYAMRGVRGDDLADRRASAFERRMEAEGKAQDEHLSSVMGEDDPFADVGDVSQAVPTGDGSRPLTPVQGSGETVTRGLSQHIEDTAVARRLSDAFGDLPQYERLNMQEQAAKANALLASDPALARRVALGEAPAPAGLNPEDLFVAVENQAIATGDVETLRALASGKLTTEATVMGQRIRTLGERDPGSPVAAMQDVIRARESATKGGASAVKRAINETVNQIQRQIDQHLSLSPAEWSAFVDSLRCP